MGKNPYANLRSVKKFAKSECALLSNSNQTFADIYNIIFQRDLIMAETSCGTQITTYTYAWGKEKIEKLVTGIWQRTNRATDKFIALSAPNSVEWVLLFWAVLKSGNKPYLVNLMQPVELTMSILQTLEVDYVISVEQPADYGKQQLLYADLLAAGSDGGAEPENQPVFGNEIAITTSGTTLKEKICIYSGKEIAQQILNSKQALAWNSDIGRSYHGRIKTFAVLPLYHIFGLEATYLWLSFFGATLVFPENMAPETLLRTIRVHEVTHIFAVPLLWRTIEKTVLREVAQRDQKTQDKFKKGIKLSLALQNLWPHLGEKVAGKLFAEVREKVFGDSVRFCISGGSPIQESTLELLNAIGYELINGYGMSEIGIAAANFSQKPKDRITTSIGRPFSSLQFRLDAQGQLQVKGDSICKKVIINQELIQSDEWFQTGDIVTMDETGKYYIQGRTSDIVINENGENLNPDFAEKAFDLSGAKCFSVLGDEKNENLMLVVQIPHDMTREAKEGLLKEIAFCEKKLPGVYCIKKTWFTSDALMDETEIKISRAKVKRGIADGSIRLFSTVEEITAEDRTNDSELKKKLRGIFAEILDVPETEITNTGHFMKDLGGSSLDYFALISRLGEEFEITVDFETADFSDFSYSLNDFEKIIGEALEKQ